MEAAIWRGNELGTPVTAVISTGWKALDCELPGGGWPCHALTEVLQPQPTVCEWRLLGPALRRVVEAGVMRIRQVDCARPIHAFRRMDHPRAHISVTRAYGTIRTVCAGSTSLAGRSLRPLNVRRRSAFARFQPLFKSFARTRSSMHRLIPLLVTAVALHSPQAVATESQCFGTVSKGYIEGSVKLPVRGANFLAYSTLAATAGRTHVHAKVADVIAASYSALHVERPSTIYVYGETGWPSGGRFKPHRTHQNGLSVDFFVPVRNAQGKSVPLPTSLASRFGYDIEFNAEAKYGEYGIDFPAIAEHLYQLDVAAKARGVGIALVIFDAPFLPKLFATHRGAYLRQNLTFMKGKPWIRHDEHYHVDFSLPCKPTAG